MKLSTVLACLGSIAAAEIPDLKPYYEPSSVQHRCGGKVGYVEIICGSDKYCEVFENDRPRIGKKYRTKAECLANRKPRPAKPAPTPQVKLPWVDLGSLLSVDCGPWGFSDELCGTQRFCEAFDSIDIRKTSMEFASTADCLAAHEPNPSPSPSPTKKLPYTYPTRSPETCGLYYYTEVYCGTKRYCTAFDTEREHALGPYNNATECFAAHEPPPSPDYTDPRLEWHYLNYDEDKRFGFQCCKGVSQDLGACGTDIYCKAFDDPDRRGRNRFRSSRECYAAFQPRPVVISKSDSPQDSQGCILPRGLVV